MRRGSLVRAAALAAGVASGAGAQEAAPTAELRLSKTEVTVGESFGVEVVAGGPAGTVWTLPDRLASETAEMRALPAAAETPPVPGVRRYEAAVFALGEVPLPTVVARYRLPDGTEGEVSAAAATVRVGSLLPRDDAERTLADVKPPLALGAGTAFWVVLAALGLGAGGLVVAVLRRRRPAARVPAARPVSAEAEAREALDRLAVSDALAREDWRSFYIDLVEVAKRYLERRLEAPVLEMTSSECTAFLRRHPVASELATGVRELVGVGDRVKFAHGSAGREEAQRHLAQVRRIVDVIEERLRPAPAAGAERVA